VDERDRVNSAESPDYANDEEVVTTTIHATSFLQSTVSLLINPEDLNWDVSRASHFLWVFVMGVSIGLTYLVLLALEQDRYG